MELRKEKEKQINVNSKILTDERTNEAWIIFGWTKDFSSAALGFVIYYIY